MAEVCDMLKPEHFADPFNANAWRAILSVYADGLSLDTATILTRMRTLGLLSGDGFGQDAYRLSTIETNCIGKRNIMHHALIVAQSWVSRQVSRIGTDATVQGASMAEDGFDLAERTTKKLEAIMSEIAPRRSMSYGQGEADELERMDAPKRKLHTTGFRDLDAIVGGYQRGDLHIVAARPAMGKTSFMVSSVDEAVSNGHPTGMFSLELKRDKMQARIFSRKSGVPLAAIVRDEMMPEQIRKRHEMMNEANSLPLWIRYDSGVTIEHIRAEATRMVRNHGVSCIVIDQLNWITPPKSGNRDGEVGNITRALKQLAMHLDVAVVLLHQLSRAVESRAGSKVPVLSDLRDSGNVEQDAQVVIFLYRPEYYGITEDENGSTIGVVQVVVAKNSNGPTGTVRLRFNAECASIHELSADRWDTRQGFTQPAPHPDNRITPTQDDFNPF
jgi:replicative DNA helicase